MGPGEWGTKGGSVYPIGPLPAQGLEALCISDAVVHAFASALQVVVMRGLVVALPSPSPAASSVRVTALSLLYLRFEYGLMGDANLPLIWEDVGRTKRRIEGINTLNQTILRGICRNMSGHMLMGRPDARQETMILVKHLYVLVYIVQKRR